MSERPSDALLAWAAIGSRISGFHHDSASKLQSLMMALDEASELAANTDAARPLETAMGALRDLHALLTENRALAKAPARKDIQLRALLDKASARHGVKLRGDVPAVSVHVAPPSIAHAIALVLDLCAGALQGARSCEVAVTAGDAVRISITPAAKLTNEITVVVRFLLEREGGGLEVGDAAHTLQLPTRAP